MCFRADVCVPFTWEGPRVHLRAPRVYAQIALRGAAPELSRGSGTCTPPAASEVPVAHVHAGTCHGQTFSRQALEARLKLKSL